MTIGISFSILAAFLFAIGNIFEKRAVDGMTSFSLRTIGMAVKQLRKSTVWILGALASILGAFVQILAYHYVSISIVQSLSVVGVVLVVIVSRLHFRESLGPLETAGLIVCAVAFLMTIISIDGGGMASGNRVARISIVVSIAGTLLIEATLLISKYLRNTSQDFIYGSSSGLMYGLVGLSAKGLSTTISHRSLANDFLGIMSSPFFYLMVAAWVLAIIIFQHGLQRGRVGIIGPLSGAVSATYVVVIGTVAFHEHLPQNTVALALRLGGFAGILLGSVLLAIGPQENPLV